MIRTLVVDDDYRVAAAHRQYVERIDGFVVVGEAHRGQEALDLVDELRPDLVLLDIYLPDVLGLEVLRRLREPARPPVDVIAVTAATDVDAVRSAIQGGVVHYLIKPFTFAAFREKLESYRALHASLAEVDVADQDVVDRLYGLTRAERRDTLPKGLSAATLEVVAAALRGGEDLSAAEVAAAVGISRVTARRYLEWLCELGRARLSLRYGSGRPVHRYRSIAGGPGR